MERMTSSDGPVDVAISAEKDECDSLRAAAMVVLWRTLATPGSRTMILAPSMPNSRACGEIGHLIMRYLVKLCKERDLALSQVTRCEQWNRIEFGVEAGWQIRLVPNCPIMAKESAKRSQTALILCAGCIQNDFIEASRALEAALDSDKALLLRLW